VVLLTQRDQNILGGEGFILEKKNEKAVRGEQPSISTPGQFTTGQFKDRISKEQVMIVWKTWSGV